MVHELNRAKSKYTKVVHVSHCDLVLLAKTHKHWAQSQISCSSELVAIKGIVLSADHPLYLPVQSSHPLYYLLCSFFTHITWSQYREGWSLQVAC